MPLASSQKKVENTDQPASYLRIAQDGEALIVGGDSIIMPVPIMITRPSHHPHLPDIDRSMWLTGIT
jgi:hypothetical protein